MAISTSPKRARVRCAAFGAAALVMALAVDAAAQPTPPADPPPDDPGCPPGAICETTVLEEPGDTAGHDPADGGAVAVPPAAPGADPSAPRWILVNPDGTTSQVITYDPSLPPGYVRPVPPPPPPPEQLDWEHDGWDRSWGLNVRVEGIMLPRFRNGVENAGMAGVGLSLRYRPAPAVAIDASVDFVGGVDANGFDRQELPFGLSAFIYVNPEDIAQFYLLGGIDWAIARVQSDRVSAQLANGTEDEYSYFGGHAGLGIEFRLTPLLGIDVDAVALLRARTDDDGDGRYPEYVDAETGRVSNVSAAGLLRAGVSFWW